MSGKVEGPLQRGVQAIGFGLLTGLIMAFTWSFVLLTSAWFRGISHFIGVFIASLTLGIAQAMFLRHRAVSRRAWVLATFFGVWLGWLLTAVVVSSVSTMLLHFADRELALVLVGLPAGDLVLAACQAFVIRRQWKRAVAWVLVNPAARLAGTGVVMLVVSRHDWRAMPSYWGLTSGALAALFLYAWPPAGGGRTGSAECA